MPFLAALVIFLSPARAENAAPATLVTVSFRPTSYVSCVANLTALALDGRVIMLPDGETKESYCRRQFPEEPLAESCLCPHLDPQKPVTGHGPPPCTCPTN
jgi:hypothetical protein